ncbi:hypothetical protein OB13_15690, partial [Pontibacter sp. HJ8]
EAQLIIAMKNSDVEKLEKLLHDDLLFILPSGQTITKAMDLETHRSKKLKVESVKANLEEIKIIGDNAIAVSMIEMSGVANGEVFEGTFKYLRVWKLFENQWKIIAGSAGQL